ncbi:MAG TPA: helix-turn-helix transcriptional regulator [Gemmatimonadales bacterium]|jgi:transcriptional regulator with XRE-family HTH domain
MNDHHPQPDLALAAWIRATRRGAGLSQAELAEQLGLVQSSVSQWERGFTQPSTPHLLRLLQMFPTAVAELIAGGTTSDAPTVARSA